MFVTKKSGISSVIIQSAIKKNDPKIKRGYEKCKNFLQPQTCKRVKVTSNSRHKSQVAERNLNLFIARTYFWTWTANKRASRREICEWTFGAGRNAHGHRTRSKGLSAYNNRAVTQRDLQIIFVRVLHANREMCRRTPTKDTEWWRSGFFLCLDKVVFVWAIFWVLHCRWFVWLIVANNSYDWLLLISIKNNMINVSKYNAKS